jgi:hypothetical protein
MPFSTSVKTRFKELVIKAEAASIESRADAAEKIANGSLDSAFTFRALQEAAKLDAKFTTLSFTSEYVNSSKFEKEDEELFTTFIKSHLLEDVARRMNSLISLNNTNPLEHAALSGVVELHSELLKIVK